MNEIGEGNIKVRSLGLTPDDQARVSTIFYRNLPASRQRIIDELPKPELSDIQRAELLTIEVAARGFLVDKMRRLDIDKPESRLPNIIYSAPSGEEDQSHAGYIRQLVGLPVVMVHPDRITSFDLGLTIMHELSHASTTTETRMDFRKADGDIAKVKSNVPMGFAIAGGSEKSIGRGIENGLAIMDEVDFFNGFLKDHYPKDYQRRVDGIGPKFIRDRTEKISHKRFGSPLTVEEYASFITLTDQRIPIIGKWIAVPGQNETLLKQYILTRELCRAVGRKIVSGDEEALPENQLVQKGRDHLDVERYKRENNAHRTIIDIYGGKDAKVIFKVDDHGVGIDEALRIVVGKESKTG
ncbi:hypothetical protein A3C23_04310 [Candidatus Roizmanbacteria bacterium RIFCSPHIGHO2_02_FULL_37_13b]|uniref:Uncharacterized protein n=1 Tax=Candidatus Roizmanbacteria bacterium RIFCSPLOWO2_02_FULL_36_11 TaxID=1802071 RepID=A0A1F7JH34_9BACT|nr:MAG: hypothetical protein A3C23_04310 [Candidatus Roizmanbacteria bacterium RIFCSPHIGHO2_02_FULL_37_13b]OGK54933.1 MAG: hypothetical protein A3H78_00455 [Candidatus Roizmanbacteria bacterium RIFCSPLOWO2_02_FULL_36_11]